MLVRAAGLEPALPYGNKILSLACLPISPRPLKPKCLDARVIKGRCGFGQALSLRFVAFHEKSERLE